MIISKYQIQTVANKADFTPSVHVCPCNVEHPSHWYPMGVVGKWIPLVSLKCPDADNFRHERVYEG